MREFHAYIRDPDKSFVCATIKAMVRVALAVPDVAETVMKGLLALVSHPVESVVAEAAVAIRQLLQSNPTLHHGVIANVVCFTFFSSGSHASSSHA